MHDGVRVRPRTEGGRVTRDRRIVLGDLGAEPLERADGEVHSGRRPRRPMVPSGYPHGVLGEVGELVGKCCVRLENHRDPPPAAVNRLLVALLRAGQNGLAAHLEQLVESRHPANLTGLEDGTRFHLLSH